MKGLLIDKMTPKSDKELDRVKHLDGEVIANIPGGYTEKEVKKILKRFSKIFNENFKDETDRRVVEWYYSWKTKSISLSLSKNNKYTLSFFDGRPRSLKTLKRTFKDINHVDYRIYQFRIQFFVLKNVLNFLEECNIDTSKIIRK